LFRHDPVIQAKGVTFGGYSWMRTSNPRMTVF